MAPLLEATGLQTHFPIRAGLLQRVTGQIKAVDGVDLAIDQGETLGLVGESGCGKSTLGRTLLRLHRPTSGRIRFDGVDITRAGERQLRGVRRNLQIVFQDPVASLNPRRTVESIVGAGLAIHRAGDAAQRRRQVRDMLERVGLPAAAASRYPHEFSGGQRQRIGIARALILRPKLVVADEPISALDVSIQSQVLNLLVTLKRDLGLTYLFIAHNLAAVGYLSDRVAVMYLGRIVELAPATELFQRPLHPYTVSLLSAIPQPIPGRRVNRIVLSGDVASPINPPSGCRFRTRCPIAQDVCAREDPRPVPDGAGHLVACHFPGKFK